MSPATTVLIPAAGRATRMGAGPGDPPKCLREVGGAPILQRLVQAALGLPEVRVVVLAPRRDQHLPAWRRSLPPGAPVSVHTAPPEPYGRTILRGLAHALAGRLAVLDSDLVVPEAELAGFLAYGRQERPGPPACPLTVGISSVPWDLGPRTIWYATTGAGQVRLGRALPGAQSRLVGAYWLRSPAIHSLRSAVAAGTTSFGEFLRGYAASGAGVDSYPFSYAYDVNTPADLAAARVHAADRGGLRS